MNLSIIKQNFVFLSLKLNIQDLLAVLLQKNLLTLYDYESLQSKNNIKRNQEFLLNLDMYGEDCECEFYNYLETLNYDLKTSRTQFISDVLHCEGYNKIHMLLMNRINATAIAAKLYECGYLKRDKLESVLAARTRSLKTEELLNDFYRAVKRPGFFSCLLASLQEIQPTLYRQVLEKLPSA